MPRPLLMFNSWVMVMLSPFGTSGRYLLTGSSRLILPSSTSCRMTVPVIGLVLLPILMWSEMVTGSVPCQVRVPIVVDQSPSGDRMSTPAPVIERSFMSWSSCGCSAAT